MSFILIDTDNTSKHYTQTTQLDGVEYLLEFIWSDRESCWYLNISDQDGNQLACLVRLIVSWSLLRRFSDARLPPGALFCLDLSNTNVDIQAMSDLGTRVSLIYAEAGT